MLILPIGVELWAIPVVPDLWYPDIVWYFGTFLLHIGGVQILWFCMVILFCFYVVIQCFLFVVIWCNHMVW
jgi:hypothetical protein